MITFKIETITPSKARRYLESNAIFAALAALTLTSCVTTLTAVEAANVSTERLCAVWGSARYFGLPTATARDELVRRGAVRQEMVAAIGDGRARIGMNSTELLCAWGLPRDVNRTTTARGITEQWVYRNCPMGPDYKCLYSFAYVENGVVRALQD